MRWGDFAGKYRIVYFGYAFCPDVCPTDMQRVAQGLKVLKASKIPAKAAKIQPIFITIDPERDTPEVVGEFAAAFSPDIIGLTGTPEQIAAAAKAFKVFYAKGEAVDGRRLSRRSFQYRLSVRPRWRAAGDAARSIRAAKRWRRNWPNG